jgi:hypothetical protein
VAYKLVHLNCEFVHGSLQAGFYDLSQKGLRDHISINLHPKLEPGANLKERALEELKKALREALAALERPGALYASLEDH